MSKVHGPLLLSLLLSACVADETTAPARIVVIADTHVIGPQYVTPSESNEADNTSIFLANDRLRALRDRIHAMRPLPDAVFVLGDVLHDAHHDPSLAWYEAHESAFSVARDLFASFEMPVHVVMGNHDYETSCDHPAYPRDFSEELFRRFFGIEPYYEVTYGGVNLYMLNGQQGRTWDPADPACNTTFASYGEAQLRWLDRALEDGKPSILMSHYMGILWNRHEVEDPALSDLATVIDAHPNVSMFLAGHTHRWLDFTDLYGYEHYVVGPSRYDDDNFWLIELGGENGPVEILDREKAGWSTSCAYTYTYDVAPMSVPDAEELGTCVGRGS